MSSVKNKELKFLSANPIRNLPAIVQAVKEEVAVIRSKQEKDGNKKVRMFKDKIGLYKF